ncbi:hypothetical protein BDA99DRAFT_467298 [Phascolomyces articulosus]|uniref:B30.2/SPRY domain-containing protein n=1 Tax=Phascolomyces articulosus TaxID=60185 RepID=A0AAD5JUG7_9FUNG|nr:hypothetical protein BDA99DRAFT_467298 [Phascolomyces articulosus]
MPVLDEVASNPASFEYNSRMVESSWRHILAIAQNHIHEYHQDNEDERRSSQEFYDRERRMVHALDTLFQLAYEGTGYLAFIATITSALDPESPVAMAFLSHIVDRAALPSRETMAAVSPVILSRLNKPTHHLYNVFSLLVTPSSSNTSPSLVIPPSTTTTTATPHNSTNNNDHDTATTFSLPTAKLQRHCRRRRQRRQQQQKILTTQQWKRPCPQCLESPFAPSSSSLPSQQQQQHKKKKKKRCHGPSILLKLNSAALWSLLAEKFAGDLCQELWTEEVGDLLLHFLADPEEDLRVRIFALIALEKFALTGAVKEAIIAHPCNIRTILLSVIQECEEANHRIFLMSPYSPVSSLSHNSSDPNDMMDLHMASHQSHPTNNNKSSSSTSPLPPTSKHPANKVKYCLENIWRDTKIQFMRLFHRKQNSNNHHDEDYEQKYDVHVDSFNEGWSLDGDKTDDPAAPVGETSQQHHLHNNLSRTFSASSTIASSSSALSDHIKQRASPPPRSEFMSHLNSFDTGFIPPEGKLRDDWTRYVQLAHCSRWALDNVFGEDEQQLACSWDLSHLKAIMNVFDATAHWKLGGNGLELRNDRPHFESIRATASVKQGKWYYETMLLTNGIMQLGWATSRCRFTPEEGYGVGDDCNGFAFDTYRTAVWADGSAVYPQSHSNVHCRAGDVLGSFLDLDNGLCTFFINGCDLGLTVEFEHPARQINQQQEDEGMATGSSSHSPMLPPPPPSFHASNQHYNEKASTTSHYHSSTMSSSKSNKKKKTTTTQQQQESVSLGLYPAVSLTTHQHILLNFGDRPWMYPPPVSVKYKGISEAGKLEDHFKSRVIKYAQKRNKPRCKSQATISTTTSSQAAASAAAASGTPHLPISNNHHHHSQPSSITNLQSIPTTTSATTIIASSSSPSIPITRIETDVLSSSSSSSSTSSYDWDGPLCTICFSEPKNIMLLPCRHTGWGERCADALDMCPLCRADIEDRISLPGSMKSPRSN